MDTEAHTSNLGFSHGRWMLPSYRLAASVGKTVTLSTAESSGAWRPIELPTAIVRTTAIL